VNPDASRSFGRASGGHAPHGSPDRGGLPGSAARRRAGNDVEPSARTRQRSKSGRGRSSCRRAPEPGTERTGTAAPVLPPDPLRPGMDGVRNGWNTAPACVLGTVWGTASNPDLAVRSSAPCLPIRQVVIAPLCPHTLRNTAAAPAARVRPVDMWTTQGRCPHPHRPQQQQQSVQFDCFGRVRLTPARRTPHLNGRLPHLCADPDSRSHHSIISSRRLVFIVTWWSEGLMMVVEAVVMALSFSLQFTDGRSCPSPAKKS